jgi:hypothetical protein
MGYRVPDHIHFRNLHGEIVLLDIRTNAYLGLNNTGAVIWEAIVDGGTATEAADRLVARFDITPKEARSDAEALINLLLTKGLLEREPSTIGGAG